MVHGYAHMAFFIDAFSIADKQYLWGLVVNVEGVGHFIGYGPVAYKVEVIKINGIGRLVSFEPAFNKGAGGATGTVFEDKLGADG